MTRFFSARPARFAACCLLPLTVLLSGCVQPKVDQQLVASPDPVALRLASAVDKASTALETLAAVEQQRNPSAAIGGTPDAPQELRRTLSLTWNGPIEPLARALADRAGYQFDVNGDMPPAPLVVSVQARQKAVIDILRDIGLQAGQRATIAVDPARRVVELNYAPVSGG